jgi:hypothetical protein
MKPRLPDEVEAQNVEMAPEGILFVGDKGAILGGFHGQDPQLFANGKQTPLGDEKTSAEIAESAAAGPGKRHGGWIEAIRGGGQSPGSFLNAQAITDTVNLGAVALRAGRKVLFDSAAMKITNVASANQYLHREYRKGWEL